MSTYINQNYSQSSIESIYNTLISSFSSYAVQDLTDILSSSADEPFSKSSTEYKILLGDGSVLTYGGRNLTDDGGSLTSISISGNGKLFSILIDVPDVNGDVWSIGGFSFSENGKTFTQTFDQFDMSSVSSGIKGFNNFKTTLSDDNTTLFEYTSSYQSAWDSYNYFDAPDIGTLLNADTIPTTALSHLSTYGVTVQQAHDFIVANLSSPSSIYNTCEQYQVSNQMIVEIFDNTYSIDTVRDYFSANGLNPASLDMFA